MADREPSFTAGGGGADYKLVQPLWRIRQRLLKKPKMELPYIWSSKPTPGHVSGENYSLDRFMHPSVHGSTIHSSQDMEINYPSIKLKKKENA